ncbi:lipid-A-disaccharide synthase [Sansalvadorimonas sp. 2012CJ34-2]|uniref:Lipid-A-disaccharide synthase n=2 Tax=Parendozoicomonas callyspongiae TaxID=2942213 RepID=A0ABT0PL55_9GAMM|nr:lipid-A-disaccharide synthase [Sansalvadorimonas sp. 2012CJ34-2]MCL6272001.1 lipid-A-disaccharide synthase [Sansalvadorimonas sp. 2012CJ34-2]
MSVTFALVAGEASGDILGAGLIRYLREHCPGARFVGIGGPLMIAEGFESLFPMDRLSVMGLVEVLGRLKELLGIRKSLREKFIGEPPAVFIGIDAPDFNLPLERSLREAGVTTMHYVSPSVWAWRKKRIFKIRDSVDHMLCLLPFEAKVYQEHGVPVTFVGHPLADQIALEPKTSQARDKLGLAADDVVVGILPGSRSGEVKRLAPLFLNAAKGMQEQRSDLEFLVPCASAQRKEQLEALLAEYPGLPVTLLDGQSHEVMTASDALLMASGTAALEGLLHKKPMVISYRMNGLSYAIIRRMVTVDFCSLPNLLAGKEIIPEILQEEATAEALCQATLSCLDKSEHNRELTEEYYRIHRELKQDASARAAEAVMGVIGRKVVAKDPVGETV